MSERFHSSRAPRCPSALGALRTGVVLASALIVGVGCASPRNPAKYEEARATVEAAREAGVAEADSLDYRESLRHLAEAEKLLADRDSQELIDHQSEMARLYATTAVARAEAEVASAEAEAKLGRARDSTAVTRFAVERAIRNAQTVNAKQTARGLVLTLGGVLFAFDSAELTPEARTSVARVAGFLIALENRDALVEGHADNTGRADYNLELSARRAGSIRDALVEFGVAESRLRADGYGSNFPVASNDTAEGREKNRRVEIVILNPGMRAANARR